jgi:predicted DNA-binding transcriptional regulator AlpA
MQTDELEYQGRRSATPWSVLVKTFRLNLMFLGIDLDDDATFDALAEVSQASWRTQGPIAWALASLEAPTAIDAVKGFTRQVAAMVPSARPMRLDEELVAIPDIAQRVGVTREAVRNWANGARHANFPLPRGVVGDNIKVWRWADVDCWLAANLRLGDGLSHPNETELLEINAYLVRLCEYLEAPSPADVEWVRAGPISDSPPQTAHIQLPRQHWIELVPETVMLPASSRAGAVA